MKRFSKSILLTILVITMVFVFVGCKSTEATAEPEPVAPAPAEPAPAPAEPAPAEPAPAEPAPAPAEPAPAEPAPAPAEPAPVAGITKTYTIAGQEIKVTATIGIATISYPTSVITEADLLTALEYVQKNYAAYLDGITYDYKPGLITLFYPASFTTDDFAAVESLTTAYVAKALGTYSFEQIETTKVAVGGETTTKTTGEGEYKYEIEYAGYKATVTYKDGVAVINYPAFITNQEVIDAARAAYLAYPQYLKDTTLVVDNGTAVMTLPSNVIATRADLDVAAKIIERELPAYVQSLIMKNPVAAAAVAKVEEAAAAAAVAEAAQAAVEAAAAAATTTAATTAAATTATTTAATTAAATTATTTAATTAAATTTASTTTAAATAAPAASTTTSAATAAPAAQAAQQAAKKSSAGLIIVIVVLVLAACAAVVIILKKKKK